MLSWHGHTLSAVQLGDSVLSSTKSLVTRLLRCALVAIGLQPHQSVTMKMLAWHK